MTLSASNAEEYPEDQDATAEITSFLGWFVKQNGGELRISIPEFENAEQEDNFLTFDVEDDDLVIRLVPANQVPVELGGKKVD